MQRTRVIRSVHGPLRPLRSPWAWLITLSFLSAMIPPSDAASTRAMQEQLDALAERYGKLETDLARTESRSDRLRTEMHEAEQVLDRRAASLSARAVHMYKQGGPATVLGGLLLAPDAEAFRRQAELFSLMSTRDAEVVDEVQIAQARAAELQAQLDANQQRQERVLASLRKQQGALQDKLEEAQEREALAAKRAAETRRAKGRPSRIDADVAAPIPNARGMVLPIAGPLGFADTWGARRSGGRRHQGTDVMAACGARVVAVASGSVSIHQGGNGGRMLYLHAANGDTYFYSHLQGYAVQSGQHVKAGQLIGYNGNSGNARGGPCHVHFEWHPKGGRPVNPYPLLRSI
ncbi:MAG: murein hydrolase activator EnvC family protein [Actinomycetota bacterium]